MINHKQSKWKKRKKIKKKSEYLKKKIRKRSAIRKSNRSKIKKKIKKRNFIKKTKLLRNSIYKNKPRKSFLLFPLSSFAAEGDVYDLSTNN